MSPTEELVKTIDSRIAQARREIASLEAALAAMDGDARRPGRSSRTGASADHPAAAGTAATTSTRPRRSRSSSRSAASGRDAVPTGKLEALLSTGDGVSTSDLAARSGGHRYQVLVLLRELEQAGRVRRSGERRGTRWHLVTDEDRISARAAELERQSTTFGRRRRDATVD